MNLYEGVAHRQQGVEIPFILLRRELGGLFDDEIVMVDHPETVDPLLGCFSQPFICGVHVRVTGIAALVRGLDTMEDRPL